MTSIPVGPGSPGAPPSSGGLYSFKNYMMNRSPSRPQTAVSGGAMQSRFLHPRPSVTSPPPPAPPPPGGPPSGPPGTPGGGPLVNGGPVPQPPQSGSPYMPPGMNPQAYQQMLMGWGMNPGMRFPWMR